MAMLRRFTVLHVQSSIFLSDFTNLQRDADRLWAAAGELPSSRGLANDLAPQRAGGKELTRFRICHPDSRSPSDTIWTIAPFSLP